MAMAWALIEKNISLIVWIGTGGMMAAFAGPLVVGALWKGVTAKGAYAGLITGFCTFLILHTQQIDPDWFGVIGQPEGLLQTIVHFLHGEGPNPFSCAAMGEFVSVTATIIVSKLTRKLPDEHVFAMFGKS